MAIRHHCPYLLLQIPKKSNTGKIWNIINEKCNDYGFFPVYFNQNRTERHYRFTGVKWLYKGILASKRLPKPIGSDLLKAMYRTRFFPSPDGLRVILALSEQESGIQWDTPIGPKKKRELRKKFKRFLSKTEKGVTGVIAGALLSSKLTSEKKRLAARLQKLTNPKDITITEYDIYLWSLNAYRFYRSVLGKHKSMVKVGKWFLDFNALGGKLRYEPQTFGLWQVNVNHFAEKLSRSKKFRKKYASLFTGHAVGRHRLVGALSGHTNKLSHVKTLSMIIEVLLKPRYENHLNGNQYDMYFFAAENLTGEMSTYRAAIQKKLNRRYKSRLIQDGDLAIYFPYSTRVNWNRRSKTQRILHDLVDKNRSQFPTYRIQDKEIKKLCDASSKKELYKSKIVQLFDEEKGGYKTFSQDQK